MNRIRLLFTQFSLALFLPFFLFSAHAAEEFLLDRVIALNKIHEPELDEARLRAGFKALVEKTRVALDGKITPREKIDALNRALLAGRDATYLSNLYWRDATLAASVLRAKGNCLSTSTLYVLIGKELNLPLRMVLLPRHAYARWDDGATRINIETTSGGGEIPDARYLANAGNPGPDDLERLRLNASLTDDEFLGELTRVAARHHAGEKRLAEALKLLDAAAALLPARPDVEMERIDLRADLTGRRSDARQAILKLATGPDFAPVPASTAAAALAYLAKDAAAEGDHALARQYLLGAFAAGPKSTQPATLSHLAFCYRALRDFRAAAATMELAAVLNPDEPSTLYNLAIMQKCDGRLTDALATIAKARKLNPESWNLQILEAGYQVLNGNRDEGMALHAALKKPRGDIEFWDIMQAWYHAATRQDQRFYDCFEYALKEARSTGILEWIDQDPDLDPFRADEKFLKLVREHRTRLTGK